MEPEVIKQKLDQANAFMEKARASRPFYWIGFLGWFSGLIVWKVNGSVSIALAGIVLEVGQILYSRKYLNKARVFLDEVKPHL